jgi:hypothetical protein
MAGMEPPTMLRLSSRTHHISARTVLSEIVSPVKGLADVYVTILLTGEVGAVEQDCKTLQTDDADDTDTAQENVSKRKSRHVDH